MYRFLLKPGWIALHLGALALAVLFVNLGFWQLQRHEQRLARNELLETRLTAEPQPLAKLLTEYRTNALPAEVTSIAFRPTTVRGRYDPSEEVLLRSANNYNGEPGYFILTPLVLADNRALLIERGWVPFDQQTPPIELATPPAGEVEVMGVLNLERVRPAGFLSSLTPRDPPGELEITAYVDTARLAAQMPYELLPLYVELREQTPPQETRLPLPLQPPELTGGSHLGYAIQWFAFTLIGVVGYGFLMRRVASSREDN